MDKTHTTRISKRVFFKHKYITHLTIIPADAILAAVSKMAAHLRGHHTRHLGAYQFRDLKNIHIIFADAAATNAANAPTLRKNQTSEYGVFTPQEGAAARPHLNAVDVLPSTSRPALTAASPPRVIPLTRATPLQVSPFPRVASDHLPPQAPNTAPHKKVPTTPTASWGPPPHRSPRPLNAASTAAPPTMTPQQCPTRLEALRDNLVDMDEKNAARRARRLVHAPLPPIEPL